MGYAIVLTFFSYNFLSLLTYTNLGTYITYIGAIGLQAVGASNSPIFLIIGFILITGFINLFVGGLSSKWMLLGPIFVPMLYRVNSSMTPDVVAAAYRIADSSTNIITPFMTYAGVVLRHSSDHIAEFSELTHGISVKHSRDKEYECNYQYDVIKKRCYGFTCFVNV